MNQEHDATHPPTEYQPGKEVGLKDKTLGSVLWSALGRISQQGLGLLVAMVLSRLLLPEAFGLIAMLTVVIGFASIFADSGLGAALIQRSEISDNHIKTSLTLNVSIGLLLSILLFASAPALAQFYSAPQLEPLARVLSISFILSSLGIVPRALATRQFKFRLLARADIISAAVSGTIAIAMAMQGAGVWSLVALTLTMELLRSSLLWWWCEWPVRLGFEWVEAKELFGFSLGLLGFNSINYWSRNADNLLIGRMISADALGLYSRAYMLMMLPLSQITSILSTVMFPVFSSIKHQPQRIASAYARAVGMVTFLAFPVSLGMFVIADPLIPILFGEQWTGAVSTLRILCWVSLIQVMANPTGWIFTSLGKTGIMFGWGVFSSIAIVGAIAIGASFGSISAVAWSYLIVNCLLFVPLYTIIMRIIDLSWHKLFGAVHRSLWSALIMAAVVYLLGRALPADWPSLVLMSLMICVGGAAYLMLAIVFRVEAYQEAYTAAGSRLGTYSEHRLWKLLAPRAPKVGSQ